KLFEQAQSGSQTSGTSGTMPDLGTTVFPAMTADAWIDAAGLVRRLQLRQDRSVVVDPATSGSAIGGLSQPYTGTTEFCDYGTDQVVRTPAASDATSAGDLPADRFWFEPTRCAASASSTGGPAEAAPQLEAEMQSQLACEKQVFLDEAQGKTWRQFVN